MADQPIRESEFLQWQADQAKAAFDQTFAEFKQSLRDTAKLRVWARRHPWAVTGAAAAGGFLLAKMVFSPPHSEHAHEDATPANGQPHAPAPEPRRHRFAWLLTPLWELVQPMLGQMIGSLLGAIAGAAGASAAGMGGPPHDGSSTDGNSGDAGHRPTEGPVPF
ncbi:MAG TPA: hypothetical protein VFW87_00260 [Pirellulales bacterium]|nr:hypothetical protein [Pirellulales bacterium]